MHWSVKLSESYIEYLPQNAVKWKIFAEFIAKFTNFPKKKQAAPMGKPCQVFIDGSSYCAGGGVGLHITTDSREEHYYAIKLTFKMANTKAQHEALLAGLVVAKVLGAKEVNIMPTPSWS